MSTLIALLQPLARALAVMKAPTHPLGRRDRPADTDHDLPVLTDETSAEEPVSAASGWHDSSWALKSGLLIRECAMERVQRQVPLSWLLET
ncbi:MAG: hypothetical protein ACKVQR_14875 [Aquabacterium sp.]